MIYLYEAGNKWVEDTLSCFKADLHDKSNNEPQKDILVYGRSQVGKTTFILNLIGIDPNKYSELENILRGGDLEGKREKGKSSTSVATLYSNSGNNYFSLEERNIKNGKSSKLENLSPIDMSQKLIEIRAGLRKWEYDKIIRIGIPSDYFNCNVKINTQIIDFPGVASDSDEEYRYVQEALSFYQLRVSAVIIFELKSKIKFLKRPLQAGLRYDLNPSKYILVTTMSFSSDMTINRFKKEGWSIKKIVEKSKEDIINELNKFQNYGFEKYPEYFPVEIGESLEKIILDEPEYGDELEKLMNQTFDSIRRLLEVKNSNTLFNVIEEIRSGKIKGYEDKIEQLTKLKDTKLRKIRSLDKKNKRKENNNDYFKRQLKYLEFDCNEYVKEIEEIEEREQQIIKGIKSQKKLSIYLINPQKEQRDYMYSCYVNDYKLIIEFVYEVLEELIEPKQFENLETRINNEFASVNGRIKTEKNKGFDSKKKCELFLSLLLNEMDKLIVFVEFEMKKALNKCKEKYCSNLLEFHQQEASINARIKRTKDSIEKSNKLIKKYKSEVIHIDGEIDKHKEMLKDNRKILNEILKKANEICDKHKVYYKMSLLDININASKRFMSYLILRKITFDQERMNRYYGESE